MVGDRAYTPAELRQQEKDQQDPAWLAWLAAMPDAIDEFLTRDIPDMPADPWTVEGLRHAELAALRLFPTWESVELPDNEALADRFSRFLGEMFVRRFEGQWLNAPDDEYDDQEFLPVVRRPFYEVYEDVRSLLTMAMDRRSGHEWEGVYDASEKWYSAWVTAGKLPMSDWITLRDNR